MRFIFDSNTFWFILEWLVVLSHYVRWIEKISNWIDVNFLERHLNLDVLFMFFFRLDVPQGNLIEDLLDSSWNNSRVLWWILLWKLCAHGKGFATSRLAICKNTDIVTIDKALNQVLNLIIDFILSRSLAKDTIEVEELRLIFVRL